MRPSTYRVASSSEIREVNLTVRHKTSSWKRNLYVIASVIYVVVFSEPNPYRPAYELSPRSAASKKDDVMTSSGLDRNSDRYRSLPARTKR